MTTPISNFSMSQLEEINHNQSDNNLLKSPIRYVEKITALEIVQPNVPSVINCEEIPQNVYMPQDVEQTRNALKTYFSFQNNVKETYFTLPPAQKLQIS